MCSRYFMEEHMDEELLRDLQGSFRSTYGPTRGLIPRAAAEGGTHPSAKFAKAISHSDQRLAAPAAMSEMDDRPSGLSSSLSVRDGIFRARDVHPSDEAPAVCAFHGVPELRGMHWGYPSPQGKGLIINARAESLPEKPMFRQGVESRRIILPASGFYEWNGQKEKNIFRNRVGRILYMAGICDLFSEWERFVIVTTGANESMRPVHERMPLILEPDQLEAWLFDASATEDILRSTPALLEREMPYEQMSLF